MLSAFVFIYLDFSLTTWKKQKTSRKKQCERKYGIERGARLSTDLRRHYYGIKKHDIKLEGSKL